MTRYGIRSKSCLMLGLSVAMMWLVSPALGQEDTGEFEGVQTEIIRVRYPNRRVKIERNVMQDKDYNYVNHGKWTMWDQEGVKLGEGFYRHGKIHGRWVRWFIDGSPQFESHLYKGFEKPFVSEATFVDGELQGEWVTYDAHERKISAWNFKNDQLDGDIVWWHPNGRKSRVETHINGVLDGDISEWDSEGNRTLHEVYREGRKFVPYVKEYTNGQKQIEGYYLHANEKIETTYDWWKGIMKTAIVSRNGKKHRDGVWTYWHENGGKLYEGKFNNDLAIGTHTWWFPNGQVRLRGEFVSGKQHGRWVWWHLNGQKQIQGTYEHGQQTGKWLKWRENGQVVEVQVASPTPQLAVQDAPQNATVEVSDEGIENQATIAPPAELRFESDANTTSRRPRQAAQMPAVQRK